MQFDDFIAQMPIVNEIPIVDRRVGIQYATRSEAFVPPPIETDDDLGSAQVVLVVAPAAVGKTTIANEIAAVSGAPIWNLAATQVGSNSFVGGLAQCFGANELMPLFANLGAGRGLVVLDALDETHLRSGYQNLEAFIQDIAQVVRESPSPSVVILARVETAVVAQLMLELAGCAGHPYIWSISTSRALGASLIVVWPSIGPMPGNQRFTIEAQPPSSLRSTRSLTLFTGA